MHKNLRACRPGDPFLKPHWRWLRAEAVSKIPGQRTDDDLVNAACDFLEHGNAGKHQALLEAALELRHPRHVDARAILEGYVLSRLPVANVASRCGLMEEVVAAYCDWFFDVRDRLSARDWVTSQVIMGAESDGSEPARLRTLWRRVGLLGGPLMLEALLAVSRGLPVPEEFLTAVGPARVDQAECLRAQILLFVDAELATTPEEFKAVAAKHTALQQRFPESVSEIPAANWEVLCGMKGRARKPKAVTTPQPTMTTSAPAGSSISSAVLATLLP